MFPRVDPGIAMPDKGPLGLLKGQRTYCPDTVGADAGWASAGAGAGLGGAAAAGDRGSAFFGAAFIFIRNGTGCAVGSAWNLFRL